MTKGPVPQRYPACILATCCIPWNADGGFAQDIFINLVARLLSGLTRDVYIFGTAGEGYAVNERQFDEVCAAFRQATLAPDDRPMVGLISLSLSTIIGRIERAWEMGFRRFQISLPSWGRLADEEMALFFRETCGRFPGGQFLHYNLPRAQRIVTPAEYGLLAATHPNLVATKHGGDSMNQCLGLLAQAPELRHFFTETGYGYAGLTESCGFLVSVASMNFPRARLYFEAGQKHDVASLSKMQSELNSLTKELVAMGMADAHMDGAFDKIFCRLHDPQFPLRLLPPYSAIKEATFEKIRALVREKYPHWLPQRV